MSENYRRVNLLIREDQHQNIVDNELNLSGLVRDLLDDNFSDAVISLDVTKRTKKLYDYIISNFAANDRELEPFLIQALDSYLKGKEGEIEKLRQDIRKQKR